MRIAFSVRASDDPPGGAGGNIRVLPMMARYSAKVRTAFEFAVQGLTEAIKTRARARVAAGGFKSRRLPFVIRSSFYANRDKPQYGGPAGIVASNWQTKLGGKDKLAPFALGLTLVPSQAKRLVVPLKAGPGFKAMVMERLLQLGSDPTLGVAKLPGGKLLVYDRRAGRKNLALAVLTPSVKMPKRIDFAGLAANAESELAERFDKAMDAAPPSGGALGETR